jgi:hypothetical protein
MNMATRKAQATAKAQHSRLSKVTIAPTVGARKTLKFTWRGLCAVARGTKYTVTELHKGIKEGLAQELD